MNVLAGNLPFKLPFVFNAAAVVVCLFVLWGVLLFFCFFLSTLISRCVVTQKSHSGTLMSEQWKMK